MAWSGLTDQEVLDEFTPQEKATLNAIQGSTATLARIVGRAIGETRGAVQGGGYPLGESGTVPDALRSDVIALARWRWLISFPSLKALQTKERKDAYDDAREKLEKVSQQKFSIESPTDSGASQSGSWNSENKLLMRTHPVPPPAVQDPTTMDRPYANPDQTDV